MWWAAEGDPSAPPLVLLPDASRPAGWFPPTLVDALVAAGWRVIRCDLAGQGRSWVSAGAMAPSPAFADLTDGVLSVLAEIGPALVCGVGLGGTVALGAAIARPDLVRRLVVVGSAAWLADPGVAGPEEGLVVSLIWRRRDGVADEAELAAVLARELRALCADADRPSPAEARAEARRWLAWGFNPADNHRSVWLQAPDLSTDLARLVPPLTVVHGAEDPLVDVAHAEALAAVVPASSLVVVPDTGHELRPALAAAIVSACGPAGQQSGARPECLS